MSALTVTDLDFAYGRRAVLEQVQLQIRPGELTMLLGANGSGKSTLMKCLVGVLTPRRGQVLHGDEDLLRMSPRQRARHLAYVPQSTHVTESGLSVYEVVATGRTRQRERTSDVRREVVAVLDHLHLADRALDRLDMLSGGERQRVLIGRALAQQTPWLLLDEPVSALDLRHQVDILGLLRGLTRERGTGVLAIVHDINLAAAFADTVLVMLDGRAVAAGPPQEALTTDLLEQVYGTPVSVHRIEGRTVVLPRILDTDAHPQNLDDRSTA
ncbi:ABC transporter ATP-binding protein [Gephyromycinifex aptenodytis]|uniref:ABC transporter ATP-binding protein n=1 Tax=Gephyromycinifex aptenodytis TaxID=2716227 RepID=UPI001447FAF8|nr:ABC transporter ATP-binding protein [Gephyromycinifex aptenodytis]